MTMKLSDNGANFIASLEGGFKLAWYKLNDGMMTVGAGHTIPLSEAKKKGITVGTKITKTQAIKWFEEDCSGFVNGTNKLLQQFGFKVNQNQFDALVSYAYNRGLGSSTYDNGLYQLLHHSKSVSAISNNFLVYWGTNTTYKKGLMNRRNAEKRLFDTPVKNTTVKKESSQVSKKQYYTTNPKKIKLLKTCNLYTSVEFNNHTKSGIAYPKGTVFTIVKTGKSKAGTTRLKVASGYWISANKDLVKKV